MTEPGREARGRRMLEEMLGADQAQRTFEHWKSIAPEFDEYVTGFVFGEIWDRPGLDRRTKSLVTIAVAAAMSRDRALKLNVEMAARSGVSRQEVVETLLQVAPYAGFPACWEGLATVDEVFGPAADSDGKTSLDK